MFNTSSTMSPADLAAVSGNDGFGNNSSWFLWLILILVLFANGSGWGNNSEISSGYTLASDFATLQRQIDSTSTNTNNLVSTSADQLQRQINTVASGLSSLGYDQLNQFNGINTNILNSSNALSTQLSNCCCTNRYEALQNANTTQSLISSGFAETNYNNATNTCALKTQVGEVGTSLATQSASNTRDIIDAQNANTQAILAKLNEQELNAKDAQISALTQQVNALTLTASQEAQNNAIISALRTPTPVPAYTVANPYSSTTYGCGCSCS